MASPSSLQKLLTHLEHSGFEGDIESDYAQRIVAATDNSIYHLVPQAILYPRQEQEINLAVASVHKFRADGFSLCARGAGTGTNGQSLSHSIILDCSRYLNRIIDFDADAKQVTLQPGVILDQLNEFLKPYGLFFPVDISSSSRATLGGMVATDASGKGSLIFGKTSRYIQSLDLVLADGSDYEFREMTIDLLTQDHESYPDFLLSIALQLEQQRDEINRIFPDMNRGLTGYNLQQCIEQPDNFNPCYLIAGSEGTLGITRRITLKLLPRPTHKSLCVIFYKDFQQALDHVPVLLESKPAAIEMLDDKILSLAQNDSVWFEVKAILGDSLSGHSIKAVNYVEHVGSAAQQVLQQQQDLQAKLDKTADKFGVILSKIETDPQQIKNLWAVRKRAVGLLGKSQDGKRGIAFVEDTAVPPQNLVNYINGFRKILDQHNLEYGMYGHADAGVLHVRPVLDMLQQQDRQLIRTISDQVAELARQNNGVLWGEHGRGFRGEYAPLFFGKKLYPVLCDIKHHFDPYNILNPGKVTTPSCESMVTLVDDVTMRGELDGNVAAHQRQSYDSAFSCNGNGSCFSWYVDEAMCPSYKATRNKLYSPKGRAALLREWLYLRNTSSDNSERLQQLENSLHDSLALCLSCKSCTATCPVQVDIPQLKSRFLEHWFTTRRRPIQDFFTRYFETLISLGRKFPGLSNSLLHNNPGMRIFNKLTRLNRLPHFSHGHYQNAAPLTAITSTQTSDQENAVILLRDNYLHSFDQDTLQSCCNLLHQLGFKVYLSPIINNGKLLHVKGFRRAFKKQAADTVLELEKLSRYGLPLISCETMPRLMLDTEYREILQSREFPEVRSIESFLIEQTDQFEYTAKKPGQRVTLLPHCMEQTTAKESPTQWMEVFAKLGIDCQIINAGCCGMSGLFGHEISNNALSDDIFNLSWRAVAETTNGPLLATGFSCRCQLKNNQFKTTHPLQYLDRILQ